MTVLTADYIWDCPSCQFIRRWRSRQYVFYLEVTVNPLDDLLKARKSKYGTIQDLAVSMKLSYSGLLRGIKKGTLDDQNILRLAELIGEPPANVFRAANRLEMADQFDRLYGDGVKPPSLMERKLLNAWNALTEDARETAWSMMKLLPRRDATHPVAEKTRAKAKRVG